MERKPNCKFCKAKGEKVFCRELSLAPARHFLNGIHTALDTTDNMMAAAFEKHNKEFLAKKVFYFVLCLNCKRFYVNY